MFPAGKGQPSDPTRPVTTLKTAWTKVGDNAQVVGRWHDNRHTLVTELAESGAGDEVIMSIAGHVSRAMLSRYSHVRMEAKRRALDAIAACQRAADEKREKEAERQQQNAVVLQSTWFSNHQRRARQNQLGGGKHLKSKSEPSRLTLRVPRSCPSLLVEMRCGVRALGRLSSDGGGSPSDRLR